jgi:RAB protein geranylgeranyltransferase component A
MADCLLVRALIHTKVKDSLNFQLIAVSYVYKDKKVKSQNAQQFMHDFGLDPATSVFIGHAMALEPDDAYLERPAQALVSDNYVRLQASLRKSIEQAT